MANIIALATRRRYDSANISRPSEREGNRMLFKSLPLSHRTAIFIAVFYPASQVIPWMYGAPLRPFHLSFITLFWGIVAFQWLQRRNPSWQFPSAGGFRQPNLIDTFGSWLERQPASFKFGYWLAVIITAMLIYRLM